MYINELRKIRDRLLYFDSLSETAAVLSAEQEMLEISRRLDDIITASSGVPELSLSFYRECDNLSYIYFKTEEHEYIKWRRDKTAHSTPCPVNSEEPYLKLFLEEEAYSNTILSKLGWVSKELYTSLIGTCYTFVMANGFNDACGKPRYLINTQIIVDILTFLMDSISVSDALKSVNLNMSYGEEVGKRIFAILSGDVGETD